MVHPVIISGLLVVAMQGAVEATTVGAWVKMILAGEEALYWFLQAFAVETPTREWVARALGMSVSSLQRRLQEQGSSFKQALELLRQELALD